jgi:hypothetical protein
MSEVVGKNLWRQCIDERRSLRVLRHKAPEVIEPLAFVRGRTSTFAHCRVLLKGGVVSFRNFGLAHQFKHVEVLALDSRSAHPWEWGVGSSPAPGFTVLYTGVNDPPISGTPE